MALQVASKQWAKWKLPFLYFEAALYYISQYKLIWSQLTIPNQAWFEENKTKEEIIVSTCKPDPLIKSQIKLVTLPTVAN